jgi:hypothetical protein
LLDEETHRLAEIGARPAAKGDDGVDVIGLGLTDGGLHGPGRHMRAGPVEDGNQRSAQSLAHPIPRFGMAAALRRDQHDPPAPGLLDYLGHPLNGVQAEVQPLGITGMDPGAGHDPHA